MTINVARALFYAWALLLAAPPAMSQAAYPDRPIHLVVTFPPGGSGDAVARMLAPRLSEKLGQSVVVDNRPGAGGNIGLNQVAKAQPDGYTIGIGAAGALSVNVSLYPQMPFDPLKDFTPVAMLAAIPFVIVSQPSLGLHNERELIDMARSQPSRLSIAYGGIGTAMHLSSQLFQQMAGVKITEVPYKGSGEAALGVLAGNVPLGMVDLSSSLQQIRSGRLVAIAVTSPQRLPQLPDVPTVAEGGLTGYDSTGWFGVVVPVGTPPAIVRRLNTEINAALNDETIRAGMRAQGIEPAPSTSEAFGRYIATETTKWGKVIRIANIKLD